MDDILPTASPSPSMCCAVQMRRSNFTTTEHCYLLKSFFEYLQFQSFVCNADNIAQCGVYGIISIYLACSVHSTAISLNAV